MSLVISDFAEVENYDAPKAVEDCYFYHTMDLPNRPTIRGHWDIRGQEDAYLGNVNFKGKTAFDCGIASGFLAFAMENRGAAVIGLDLDPDQDPYMGTVPHWDYKNRVGISREEAVQSRRKSQGMLRNSFLFAREAYKSKVRLMTGNIMLSPIPQAVQADYAFFGAILLHLRDPTAAIFNVAANVKEAIIITDNLEVDDLNLDSAPNMMFRPSANDGGNVGTWFYMFPSYLKRVLEVAGFTKFSIEKVYATHDLNKQRVPFFTLVARR